MLKPCDDYEQLYREFHWEIPERYNIGVDVCDKWAEREPGRLALIHLDHDWRRSDYSFGDLKRLSNQVANMLQADGIEIGDRVGILLPQTPETGYSHIAVYKLGAIAIPLFTLFGVEALEYRLGNSTTRVVITDREGAEKLNRIRHKLPALERIYCIDGEAPGCIDFHQRRQQQPGGFQPLDTHSDDPALIIYTSGTTGQPKGALHAQRTLLAHLPGVEMSHDFLPMPGDRFWTPADWAWIGGLYDVLMPAWHHGIPVVSHRFAKFDPEMAFRLIAEFEVRNSFLPPTALKLMRTVRDPKQRWELRMRSIASAGEPLGGELLEWGREVFGLEINEFYGQTECNMIVSNCGRIKPCKPGVMGLPAPGHKLAIIDAEGNELPRGQQGSIAVRRPDPVMFLQYWANPEGTRNKYLGDWLLTGDIGFMDDEGYLHFVSRDDDLIASGGYRIGPGEIEDCLMGHPAVKMAAVVGVPDAVRTEIIKAFIVLNEGFSGDDALKSEIQAYVRERLAAHEYPRAIAFMDQLPLTNTGKVIRRQLREQNPDGR